MLTFIPLYTPQINHYSTRALCSYFYAHIHNLYLDDLDEGDGSGEHEKVEAASETDDRGKKSVGYQERGEPVKSHGEDSREAANWFFSDEGNSKCEWEEVVVHSEGTSTKLIMC